MSFHKLSAHKVTEQHYERFELMVPNSTQDKANGHGIPRRFGPFPPGTSYESAMQQIKEWRIGVCVSGRYSGTSQFK